MPRKKVTLESEELQLEEVQVEPPIVLPAVEMVADAALLNKWFRYAYQRRSNAWNSVRIELTDVSVKLRALAVALICRAIKPGGLLYIEAQYAKYMELIQDFVNVDEVLGYYVYARHNLPLGGKVD
jgi:hypothetical protein